MVHRDSLYQLSGTIKLDDALVGGKKKGKRGRGVAGKKNMLIACESKEKKAGFIAMEVVDSICHFSAGKFINKHL